MSSIDWPLLFDIFAKGPCPPFLLAIIYVIPRFTINLLILWLGIYSFMSPIRIILHVFIFFHSLLGGGKCFQVLKLSQYLNEVIFSSQ